ncbi:MAG: hypothetical protein JJE46_15520 [Acidimicrobiia bacterium]|nr:hypothetical protein [Acidimicrobiia bacterium]
MEPSQLDDLELELRKLPGVRAAGFSERDDMLLVQVQVSGDQPPASLPQQAARIAYRHADKPVALEIVRWRTVEVPAQIPEPTATVPTPAETESPVATPPPANVTPVDTSADESADASAENAGAAVVDDHPSDSAPRARVRLLAVLTFPDTDELEVHLTFGGRRIIGRSAASAGIAGAANATLEGLRSFAADLTTAIDWTNELADHDTDGVSVVAVSVHAGADTRLGIAAGGSRIEAAARATLHALNRSLEEHLGTDEPA